MKLFQRKIALVTGSSGGIGKSIVQALIQEGSQVIAVDRPGLLAPKKSISIPCDLSNPESVKNLLGQIHKNYPSLDLIVHAAGITRDGVIWKMDRSHWDQVMEVNLNSAFEILKGCSDLLRHSKNASVILISSINGERGKFGQANYAASKAGLIALAKSAARELGRFGIRVNAIAPGMIETAMTRSIPKEIRQKALDESALGRIGQPQDVAQAVLFLGSSMSRHITGQVLRIDGGQLTA